MVLERAAADRHVPPTAPPKPTRATGRRRPAIDPNKPSYARDMRGKKRAPDWLKGYRKVDRATAMKSPDVKFLKDEAYVPV